MKITAVTVEITPEPKAHPVRDAIQLRDRDGLTRVRIDTDEGVSGVSTTYFGRVESSPAVLAKIVTEQLAPAIIGAGWTAGGSRSRWRADGLSRDRAAATEVQLVDGCYPLPAGAGLSSW